MTDTTSASSTASADYCGDDYASTEFEVVLETLFDDDRLQLTEKILRPIAVGQPFLLVATHGSLEYLRSYGFKTFDGIIDESYDAIEDPLARLSAVVAVMKEISCWHGNDKNKKMAAINQIVQYNRQHFFSKDFTHQVVDELRINLSGALDMVETTNTGKRFINEHKKYTKMHQDRNFISRVVDRQSLAKIIHRARSYRNRR